jgi:Na+-transporting NADH:ubiquinone oxidoreductase subunit B
MGFEGFELKKFVQYQKPQADMLIALSLPLTAGVYNFGWRVLLVTVFSMLAAWAAEYAFTRLEGKPVTTAGLVTGALLALILPPNVPFWQVGVGSVFSIVFGKMVFGGFGRNVFNPAMVGRCFLYICFPATIAAAWYVPFQEGPAGFIRYSPVQKNQEADVSMFALDGTTSATTFAGTKRLNHEARAALAAGKPERYQKAVAAFSAIDVKRLFFGNESGSMGETSALLILVSVAFLIYRGVVTVSLCLGPLLGMLLGKVFMLMIGADVMPFGHSYLINVFGGGTMFAIVFMTTEPISAPSHWLAKWGYGTLIGFLAVLIRVMSSFNAGFMFSILLGNMFAPLLDLAAEAWDKSRKAVTA